MRAARLLPGMACPAEKKGTMLTTVLLGADFGLTELLGSAGATIGVIIAGTIFLQFLSSKYVELFGRYRDLTREYRGGAGGPRHGLLQNQIHVYRRRLWLLNRASWLAAVALLCFLVSVLLGGFSMVWPHVVAIKWTGAVGLFSGLALTAAGVALELYESVQARGEIGEEAGDLDSPAKGKGS